ncbi:hypothetical protein SKAU_G00317590 [Synaphobranchus kaupii]|uniref:Uncharacterized protein n=1 Tax=Synaphobranchus kaupii TaxID=118154 RepID=A0A9Q1ESW8_SYNKA|nr:hypothetical protein SKAU_G00317590 [Synaphobranchus kaupii]
MTVLGGARRRLDPLQAVPGLVLHHSIDRAHTLGRPGAGQPGNGWRTAGVRLKTGGGREAERDLTCGSSTVAGGGLSEGPLGAPQKARRDSRHEQRRTPFMATPFVSLPRRGAVSQAFFASVCVCGQECTSAALTTEWPLPPSYSHRTRMHCERAASMGLRESEMSLALSAGLTGVCDAQILPKCKENARRTSHFPVYILQRVKSAA